MRLSSTAQPTHLQSMKLQKFTGKVLFALALLATAASEQSENSRELEDDGIVDNNDDDTTDNDKEKFKFAK